MDIKTLELVPRNIQAVQFTGSNASEVKQWIQDKLAFQQVTANETRLYLPTIENGMDILEPSDWVMYDPIDNGFRGATDEAVKVHYREVQ